MSELSAWIKIQFANHANRIIIQTPGIQWYPMDTSQRFTVLIDQQTMILGEALSTFLNLIVASPISADNGLLFGSFPTGEEIGKNCQRGLVRSSESARS